MTKTSEFSWDKETAKSLMDKFEAFWSQNPEQYGITGRSDAATGTANARNLFMTMKNHGKTSRKNETFAGAGFVWDDLEEIVEDNLVLEDEVKTFELALKTLDAMEGSDRDPRNIVFNTVVEYDSETGESTRDKVRGHFLTLAYWNFRKDKDSSYPVEKPKPSWVSEKKNDAEPPLWRIIFGRKNSLRTLVQDIFELAKKPTPPPTAHLDVKISSGKAGQLASIPAVQEAVRSVLNESSIYNAGKSRAPNKGRLNDAMAAMVIPSTPEIMRIVAKEATVLVENDGKIIRRKLVDFPGYEDIKSITLNFPRNNIVLNKLIREVMGEDMKTFEKPGRVEDGPIGLVLKSEPEDLIRYASDILKDLNYTFERNPSEALGVTSYDSELNPQVEISLPRILEEVNDMIRESDIPDILINPELVPGRRGDSAKYLKDEILIRQIIDTIRHESVHEAQYSETEYRERKERYIQNATNFIRAYFNGDDNVIDLLEQLIMESCYIYFYEEAPAYWVENLERSWNRAVQIVRGAYITEQPLMKLLRDMEDIIRQSDPDFQGLFTPEQLNVIEEHAERAITLVANKFMEELNDEEN